MHHGGGHMKKTYRISIPISLKTKKALEQLSEVTGASVGSTGASFLDEMAPSISLLAEAYKAAKLDPARGAALVNSLADEAAENLKLEQNELNKKVKK
jgi:hypothetical protein